VKNFEAGNYVLYSNETGTQIMDQNKSGRFVINGVSDDTYVFVQHINGSCKSPLTRIKITAVDKSAFAIASAFTPDGDGLNDRLNLKIIGVIDVEYFKIYNRNGEEVFSSKIINSGWDGTFRNIKQPSGAYVWMAKGKDISGKLISEKGSIVLVR
jgi:gliding motility-associated-like protein